MEADLKLVEECVRAWQPGTEQDDFILQYIHTLAQQAAQDSDTSELKECLNAYIFPDSPSTVVDEAIAHLLSRLSKGSDHATESASISNIPTANPTINPTINSSINPTTTPSIPLSPCLSTAPSATLPAHNSTSSSSALLAHNSTTPSPALPAETSTTSSFSLSSSFSSLKLNPNALVFVPRATPPSNHRTASPNSCPSSEHSQSHTATECTEPTANIEFQANLDPTWESHSDPTWESHSDPTWESSWDSRNVSKAGHSTTVSKAGHSSNISNAGYSNSMSNDGHSNSMSHAGFSHEDCIEEDWDVSEWDLTPQEAEEQFLKDAGVEWEGARECTGDQALAILLYWFPSYAVQVLGDMLAANHGDLAKTYAELSTMELDATAIHEAEDSGSFPSPPHRSRTVLPASVPPSVVLDESHFPSLSGSSPPGSGITSPVQGQKQAPLSFAGIVQSYVHRPPPTPPPAAPTPRLSAPLRPPPPSDPAPVCVPWVSTGEEVAAQYGAARHEARDHARLRNMCFQQATLAFLSGNKALAKELSRRGRHHSELMKHCHLRASHGIFTARNAHLSTAGTPAGHSTAHSSGAGGGRPGGANSGKSGPSNFVDLHGIHASEAEGMMDSFLTEWKRGRGRASGQQAVLVCVGTGHHTKVSKARLPEAVEAYLKDRGMNYSYAQPGLIRILL